MESNLKARAFAGYFGSVLNYIGEDRQFREKSPYKLLGVEINSTKEMIFVNGGYAFHPDSCQIELKPLSEITDEDAIEVTRLADNDIEDGFVPNEKERKAFINSLFDSIEIGILPYHIADYLRSKSYLLPFAGYDLLKENIATLKTQK